MPRHNIKKFLEVIDKIPQKEQKEKDISCGRDKYKDNRDLHVRNFSNQITTEKLGSSTEKYSLPNILYIKNIFLN